MILTFDEVSGFLKPQQCPLLWFFQVPPHVNQQQHKEPLSWSEHPQSQFLFRAKTCLDDLSSNMVTYSPVSGYKSQINTDR